MGVCASSPTLGTARLSRKREIRSARSDTVTERIRQLSGVVRVINAVEGGVQEYKTPVKGRHVIRKPGSFLCSSEHMSVGMCAPCVADDEDLSPTQIYFILSEAQAQRAFSLPDLCSLAITASFALRKAGVDFSCNSRELTGLG